MSIRTKLIIMFLAMALIPLIFVSAVTFHNYENSLQNTRLSQLKDIAVFKAERIENYLSGLKSNLAIAQSFVNIRQNFPVLIRYSHEPSNPEFVAAKKILDGQLQRTQAILGLVDILLIDPDGTVVYTSNPKYYAQSIGQPLPAPGRKAFVEGKTGMYLSDVFRYGAKGAQLEMLASAPVNDINGTFIGVIAFEIDMGPIKMLIQDNTGLGYTGETLVAKKEGQNVRFLSDLKYIPGDDFDKSLRIGTPKGIPIQIAVSGETGAGESVDYRGEKTIAAWRYIPSLGWGMVAKVDSSEAFADVLNLKRLMLFILGIVAFLGGIMAVSLARSIANPIKKLTQGAELIGAGQLEHKVALPLKDEVGQLSRTFDKMTQDLKSVMASREELNREIAERKRSENELRLANERLGLAQQAAGAGIWSWDMETGKLDWSPELFRLFGYEPGEVEASFEIWRNRLHPEDSREAEKRIEQSVREHVPHDSEYRVVLPNGDVRWVSSLGNTTYDDQGRPLRMSGICLDITERKNAEKALLESQAQNEFLAGLIRASSQPVAIGFIDGRLGMVNRAFEELTGYTAEELRTIDWANVLTPPEWHAMEREKLAELLRTGNPVRYEKEYIRKDSTRIPIELLVHLQRDSAGDPQYYYSFLTDITERKRAEAVLREREEQLRLFAEHAPAAIAMLDAEMRYVAVSERWLEDYGLKGQDLLGRSHYEIFPEIPEGWKEIHRRCLAGQVERSEEDPFIRADGTTQWLRWEIRPWYAASGAVGGIIIFSEDITEWKFIVETLKKERANLQTIFEAVNVGMLLIGEDGGVRNINQALVRWIGRDITTIQDAQPGDILGCLHAVNDAAGCGHAEHCSGCPLRRSFEDTLLTGKGVHGVEVETSLVMNGSATPLWFDISVDPLMIDGKRHVILVLNNITERKKKEEELFRLYRTLRAMSDSDQAMMRAQNEQDYLDAVCRMIVEDCGHAMVWIGFAEEDAERSVRPVAQAGFEDGYLSTIKITWADNESGRGPTGTAIRTGRPSMCRNMLNDPDFAPWRAEAIKRGYASSLVLPISIQGKVFGAITIYSQAADAFSEDEVALLTDLADDLAYGITALRLRVANKQAEEKLKSQHQEMQIILDSVPALIFYKDKENRFLRVNAAFSEVMEIPKEGLEGKTLRDIYPEEQANAYWKDDLEVITSGIPKMNIIEPMQTKNGERWLQTDKIPYRDERGRTIGVIGFAVDITERRLAETTIQRSLQRFELLSRTAGELLQSPEPQRLVDSLCRQVMETLDCQAFFNFLVDEEAKRLHLNACAGIPDEEIRRMEWLDFGVAVCGCVAQDGCRIVAEHIPTSPDPRTELVKSFGIKAYACHPLMGKKGKVMGTLSFGTRTRETFSEDELSLMKAVAGQVSMAMIRIRDEEELKKSQLETARAQVMQTERQRLYSVLETLPVYVVLLTPDYHTSFANKFFRDRFGEDHGRCCYDQLFHRSTPCENCETYKVLKTNAPHEWEWTGPDGRNYEIYDFPFKETDGTVHIMEMGIDVTERKKAQEALLETQREMDRAKRLSDIGTLASTVAHELRNPLAGISMAAENIRRKANNPNLERHLANISMKVSESDQIINNLLFYTRLKPPHYETISLSRIIDECVEVSDKQCGKKVFFVMNVGDISIKADPLQMREIFNNILRNACDAVPQEGGQIEISSQEQDGYLRVVVKDNGHGMSQEMLKKVFDPFFTTKAKGTGLGLSVCQQIVTFHGGTIELESEVGKGTSVIVMLPKGNAVADQPLL